MRRTLCILFVTSLAIALISCNDSDDDSGQNPVFGSWRVTAIQVSQEQLTQFAPSDEDIIITFNSGSDFSGETSVNQFGGRYELDGTTLTMLEFSTTEVADTQFAGAFYEAIAEAQVPNETFAQFGYSFDSLDLILVFGNSGQMTLEQQ
ncbi:MAG: META domain-containing protein [Bacteroidota bacterium]